MDDPDSAQIILIIVLLLLSGFFSASETALSSLTPAKVRTLVESEKPGAKYLEKLKKNHHKTLITILVGNNFVNILAASMTTVVMTDLFGSAAVGIATGVLTIVILIFGEVVPKSLATTYAKGFALFVSPILYFLEIFLTPIIWTLDKLVRFILAVLGTEKENQVTEEELLAMASIGEEEGSIDEQELELIENVLEFDEIKARDIMTPRVHIDAVPEDFTMNEATAFVLNHTHTRIPVYRENVDNIVGIVALKDLLKAQHKDSKESSEDSEKEEQTLRQIQLSTPLRVAASIKINALLLMFRKSKTHLAIVLDEHGGTAGLITMEDILEELVGEIEDESDKEDWIKKIAKNHYEISGRLDLEELTDVTGLEFEYPEHKTISFLLVEEAGQLPKKGQTIRLEDWQFTVTQMHRNTVLKVEVKKLTST